MTAIGTGFAAYRKAMLVSGSSRLTLASIDSYSDLKNRLDRYAFWWAMYENKAYDNDSYHGAREFKKTNSLYQNTRGCYNPFGRIGDFYGTHIWIGRLDALKQNGRVADSACPILCAEGNDAIREPIARLWRDSNWASNKEIEARVGSVMGDHGLRIDDDTAAGKVRIIPINPDTVHWAKRDDHGNIDAYVICERRFDPRHDPRNGDPSMIQVVDYEERVTRVGSTVHYQTLLNGSPYPWNGISGEYEVEYGFVPLVLSPHIKARPDLAWGWSEFHKGVVKAMEADHVASNLHSQIRKAHDPGWWASGTQPPAAGGNRVPGTAPSASNPNPQEQELKIFYGGAGSSITPMVFNLDVQFTSMEIQNQIASLEKDYPELRYESARATGDASAKALRETRKACEAKVHGRRVSYDDTLARAQMMALSIGGMRGYEGYEAFSIDSYRLGHLDHSIGERTVFLLDPLDRSEELKAFFDEWQVAKLAGVPDEYFLWLNDYSPAQIERFKAMKAESDANDLSQQTALIEAQAAATPPPKAPAPAP